MNKEMDRIIKVSLILFALSLIPLSVQLYIGNHIFSIISKQITIILIGIVGCAILIKNFKSMGDNDVDGDFQETRV